MSLTMRVNSKKYLMRLLLSVTLLLLALLSASSAALYIYTERSVLNIQQSANEKMLGQTIYNLDSMNEILKTTIVSSYFDSEVSEFLYGDLSDTYTLYQHLSGLEQVMKGAPFLHSIMTYNERNHCYYTYSPSAIQACQPEGSGLLSKRYLAEHPSLPKLTLLPVSASTASGERRPIDYFSYAMFSDRPTGLEQKGMLVLNVRADWLFAQLSGMNRLKDNGDSRTLLLNSAGELYDPGSRSWSQGGDLYGSLLQEMRDSGKNADLYVHGTGPSKEIVSYMKSEKYDWVVVSLQPYAQVFGEIMKMRSVSFSIIALFLFLALAASAALAFRLYHPIEILLRKIRASTDAIPIEPGARRKDEMAYISNAFQRTLEQVQQLEQSQGEHNVVLRTFYLKKLVLESETSTSDDIREIIRHYGLDIGLDSPYLLVGFHSDDFKPHTEQPEMVLFPLAVSRIAGEQLSEYQHELIDMGSGCIVAVISLPGPLEDSRENLLQRILATQAHAMAQHLLSLTLTISPVGTRAQQMASLYELLRDYANYRMITGRMSIITAEQVETNLRSGQFLSSPELEKRLAEGVKSGRLEAVELSLREWFRSLHALKYEQMLYGMFHLLGMLHKLVEEINANRLQSVVLDTREMYGLLAHVETLHEAEQLFRDKLAEIVGAISEPGGDQTHQLVAHTIHEIIHARYMDPNLCLPEIASMVRLSSAHVSKLFKSRYGAGIPEYLNEVRLQQAIAHLSRQEFSVNQIMERVGFTNQSYFFRLFKKRYGTTPKEYRLKQVL